ncbi:MAG: ExbD/TolR family protein [Chitinophagales bacterium]
MADVQLQQNHHSRSNRKRMLAKVDLTPMVDLAFLLITFFMLTTTLKEKNAMLLHMPDTSGNPQDYPESALLTFILDKSNIIWYYQGREYLALEKITYDEEGLRSLIYNRQESVQERFSGKFPLVCIIKTTNEANYKNLVDILDEMEITDVKSYAIQGLSELEKITIAQQ